MSSHLAIALLSGLASLLVGLIVGRGLLKRRQSEKCRELAKDLTDKVHDRCDAYRRLEERISGVIGDFDQQSVEPVDQPIAQTQTRAAPAAAACGEGLSWMDSCAGTCPPAAAQVDASRIAETTTTTSSSARTVESEVDVFAQRLRGVQDSNRALIEEQSRAIEDLKRRLASMEFSSSPAREPLPAAFGAPRRVASQDPGLGALSESLSRSERELHEWRARCEEVVQEREAGIARAREALASLRCENCERARDLAQQILELHPGSIAQRPHENEPRAQRSGQQVAAASEAEVAPPANRREPAPKLREVEELERRLAAKSQEAESMRSELSRAGQVIDGKESRITHLMRSLEQTQAKAEERRRLVQEQTTQVTEAYSMLDRMRPLLRAIESAAAENQSSALTPEYLEARSRG